MGLDVTQLRDEIIIPTLQTMSVERDLATDAAVELLLGTAAVESRLEAVRQYHGGPARSIYQIEPPTYFDVLHRLAIHFPSISTIVRRFQLAQCPLTEPAEAWGWSGRPSQPRTDELIGNLWLATAIARGKYWLVTVALPAAGDREGQARYWLRWYNAGGAGTVRKYLTAWNQVIAPNL